MTAAAATPDIDTQLARLSKTVLRVVDERNAMLATLKFVEEEIGWRGVHPSTADHFQCEFCDEEHLDSALIEHKPACVMVRIRAAISLADQSSK